MADKPPEFDEQKFAASLIELSNLTWNEAIETAAATLQSSYPDHKWVNAYAACVRSLKRGM